MLEYILIVVFVVIASVAVWSEFGDKVKNLIQGANEELSGSAICDSFSTDEAKKAANCK